MLRCCLSSQAREVEVVAAASRLIGLITYAQDPHPVFSSLLIKELSLAYSLNLSPSGHKLNSGGKYSFVPARRRASNSSGIFGEAPEASS